MIGHSVASNKLAANNFDDSNGFASNFKSMPLSSAECRVVNSDGNTNSIKDRSQNSVSSTNHVEGEKLSADIVLPEQYSTRRASVSPRADAVRVQVCDNSLSDDISLDMLDLLLNTAALEDAVSDDGSVNLSAPITRPKLKQTFDLGRKKVSSKLAGKQEVRFQSTHKLETSPQFSVQGSVGTSARHRCGNRNVGRERVDMNRARADEDKLLAEVFFTN